MDSSIDETARRRFEQAWQEKQSAPIESFLPQLDDPRYLPTLEELVHVELELAWKSSRASTGLLSEPRGPLVESYLARFPALGEPAIVRRLIGQEYWVRHRYGDQPDRQSYGSRFTGLDLSGVTWEDQFSESSVAIPVHLGPAGPLQPTAIAGYEILAELGRGGMGVVYKARQLSLNRVVAIKMILSGAFAGEEELRRFHAEAAAIARLQDPNIVQIHEIGQHEGRAYLSLEFVDGPTLARKLDHKPQSPKAAAQLMEKLARAMERVHAQGIIHRDLKPANVLLSPDGTPKIGDFGLAKQMQAAHDGSDSPDSPEATLSGKVIGTPNYASPEQAAGRISEITAASDVYALGSILYEMLTGRPPFQGSSPVTTIMQVMGQEPVAPSRLVPKVPRDLETICLKCLQKQPRKRYASAADLAEDLRRFIAGEPILARPVSNVERVWRWSLRNPLLAAMSAAALASLIAVAVVSTVFSVQLRRTLDVVVQQRLAAQKVSTTMALGRGLMLCRQNQPQEGLLWLARGVQIAPGELDDLRWALRMNIAAWSAELPTARPRRLNLNQTSPVVATAWSGDGRGVFTATRDGQVDLWEADTGKALGLMSVGGASLTAIALSPDSRMLVSAFEDGTASLSYFNPAEPTGPLLAHGSAIRVVQFSPDGGLLATGSDDGVVCLWDVRTGQSLRAALPQAGPVCAVAFSPDSRRLAVAGGQEIGLWNATTGQRLVPPLTHTGNVTALAFRLNGNLVTWASDVSGRAACVEWDAGHGTRLRMVFARIGEAVLSAGIATFSPDGEMALIKASDSGKPHLVRIDSAEQVGPAMDHGDLGMGQIMSFSRDGRLALTVGMDNAVRIWEVPTARQIGPALESASPIRCAMFSPDAKRLLIGSADGSARIWELAPAASWPPFQPVQGSHPPTTRQGKFLCIASSPDGRTTATATDDGMVHLTSAANEGPDRVIGPLASPVLAMAFSPDGALLLTGAAVSRAPGAPGEGRLWRTSTGQPVGPPLRHLAAVTCVAFSPDGKLALTGSDDQTARLWSVAVGCSIGRAMQHPGEVEQVAFDPDGRRLTTLCLARPTRRAELVADDPEDEETPPQLTRTWVIPNPAAEDAQVLVSRVESMTGLELGPGDVVQEAREP